MHAARVRIEELDSLDTSEIGPDLVVDRLEVHDELAMHEVLQIFLTSPAGAVQLWDRALATLDRLVGRPVERRSGIELTLPFVLADALRRSDVDEFELDDRLPVWIPVGARWIAEGWGDATTRQRLVVAVVAALPGGAELLVDLPRGTGQEALLDLIEADSATLAAAEHADQRTLAVVWLRLELLQDFITVWGGQSGQGLDPADAQIVVARMAAALRSLARLEHGHDGPLAFGGRFRDWQEEALLAVLRELPGETLTPAEWGWARERGPPPATLRSVRASRLFDELVAFLREHPAPEGLAPDEAAWITVRDLVLYTIGDTVWSTDVRLDTTDSDQLRAGLQHEIDFHVLGVADMADHDTRAVALLDRLGLEPLTSLVLDAGTAPAEGQRGPDAALAAVARTIIGWLLRIVAQLRSSAARPLLIAAMAAALLGVLASGGSWSSSDLASGLAWAAALALVLRLALHVALVVGGVVALGPSSGVAGSVVAAVGLRVARTGRVSAHARRALRGLAAPVLALVIVVLAAGTARAAPLGASGEDRAAGVVMVVLAVAAAVLVIAAVVPADRLGRRLLASWAATDRHVIRMAGMLRAAVWDSTLDRITMSMLDMQLRSLSWHESPRGAPLARIEPVRNGLQLRVREGGVEELAWLIGAAADDAGVWLGGRRREVLAVRVIVLSAVVEHIARSHGGMFAHEIAEDVYQRFLATQPTRMRLRLATLLAQLDNVTTDSASIAAIAASGMVLPYRSPLRRFDAPKRAPPPLIAWLARAAGRLTRAVGRGLGVTVAVVAMVVIGPAADVAPAADGGQARAGGWAPATRLYLQEQPLSRSTPAPDPGIGNVPLSLTDTLLRSPRCPSRSPCRRTHRVITHPAPPSRRAR